MKLPLSCSSLIGSVTKEPCVCSAIVIYVRWWYTESAGSVIYMTLKLLKLLFYTLQFSKNYKKYKFDFHSRILLSYKIFDPLSYFLIFVAGFIERYAFHVTFSRNKVIQLIINSRRTQNHFYLPTHILSCSFFAFKIRTVLD